MKIKKKILVVTEYFYPEEFKINELVVEWKKKGYDVDVLTQNPTYPEGKILHGYINSWYNKDEYNDINVFRVKAVSGYKTSLFKKLLKYFAFMILGSIVSLKIGRRYDYVFAFDVGALTGMVPAVILQKFYDKPVTIWIQDVWPDSVYAYGFKKTKLLEFFLNKFVRFVYRNTSSFAVSGEGFRDKVTPYLDTKKDILYAPNWADELDETYEPFSFSKDEKIHFTFAGNIGKVQNLDNVIRAFSKIDVTLSKKAQLNIIGDGSYLEALKNLVEQEKILNVVFWGRKPRKEMQKYFQASDFLIVSLIDKPIFSLTVPAKVQTYIAAKRPIIAIIEGDAAKIVAENELGFAVKPNDLETITKVFEKSITLPQNQKKLFIQNSQRLSETIFNKNEIVENLLKLTVGKQK